MNVRKITAIILALVMTLSMITVVHGENFEGKAIPGSLIFYDGFDTKETWSAGNGIGPLTIESDAEHSSYMKLEANDNASILKRGFDGISTGKAVMEFDIMADNETEGANKYIFLTDGANGQSIVRLFFGKNNTITATNSGGELNLGAFEPDIWHHVSMEIDVSEKAYDIYFDGELVGNAKFQGTDPAPNLNYITIRADKQTGYLAIDNLAIYYLDGKAGAIPTPKIPTKYETIQRYPTPTPLPTQTPNIKTGKEVVYYQENFDTWPEWVTNEKDKAKDDTYGNYLGLTGYTRYTAPIPTAIREGENITLEFDYRSNNNGVNSNKSIALRGNGTSVISCHFNRNGNVNSDLYTTYRFHIGGVNVEAEGLWHHFKAVLNSYTKEYTVYVDDKRLYTVAQYDVKTPMEITSLTISMGDGCGTYDITNIKLYDPDGTVQPDEPREVSKLTAKVLDHKFADMVGKPNSKGSIHYTGHPAEIHVLTLNSLGLINGYPDGTFKPDNTITRAEFAAIVSRAFKLEDKPVTTEFTDVPSTHWATGNIGAAYAAGIINGYGDGTFGPEDPIKEEQAVKMVVAALGYNDDAVAKGGYPMGYIQVGNEKYISRGLNVHKGEEATRGLVAQIMFYALGAEIKGAGKTLYDMHSDKAGASIGQKFIDAMLQDYYYYREEALEVMMYNDITPLQAFNSMLNVFETSTDKEERTRAARVLSEFIIFDIKEYNVLKYDKAYMEMVYGRLNQLAAGTLAMAANNPDEDEDVRLYALRALYLLDREDLVDKTSWTLAFKTKAMTTTRHLTNKAQDILEMTNDEASVNALIKALSDSDVEVVLRAVDTLGRKGLNPTLHEKATVAIPELQKLLNHTNSYVQYRAYDAIKALGGTPDKEITPTLHPYNDSTQNVVVTVDGVEYKYGDPIPTGRVVIIQNGNVNLQFDSGDNNSFAGIKKLTTFDNSKSLLLGYGFITWNASMENGSLAEHDGARSQGIRCANADYAEYYYRKSPTERFPYTLDVVYRVPRGESGFYLYYIEDKAEGTAAIEHCFAAPMFRMNEADWEYEALHDKLQINQAFSKKNEQIDTEYGRKDIYQSVYRNQTGELDAKHEFNPYQLDSSIEGCANDRLGFWHMYASKDSTAKILKNDNKMLEGLYFTWDHRPTPAGKYHKVYGPIMVYLNKGDTFLEKWEDAKNKLEYEKTQWPYAWVEDDHFFERGSISGKVEMFDGSSPEGAYVVVNMPGETNGKKGERYVTWCQSNSPYQYWTRADKDGNWSIDNVHSDTYTVTVWKEGYPGEVAKENVFVEPSINTDVGTITFKEYSNGTLSWRVGDADRTWLYDSEKNFDWSLLHYYPLRFPNDVEFKVGESVPKYDWNYAQIKMDTYRETPIPFNIVWDIDEIPEGQPVLTVTTCSSRNTGSNGFKVYVNGTLVKTLDYSDDDSMVMRTHSYGKLIFNPIEFDKSLLKTGENKVTLEISSGEISYDFVQLEYK